MALTVGGRPGGLSIDSRGFLYGVAVAGGGAYDTGTLFRLDPPYGSPDEWRFAVLHTFGADAVSPSQDEEPIRRCRPWWLRSREAARFCSASPELAAPFKAAWSSK